MKKIILGCWLVLLTSCASTDTTAISEPKEVNNEVKDADKAFSLVEYCEDNHCRRGFLLKLRTDGEPLEQLMELYPPVVQGDQLSLLPGDKVYIEAEIVKGKFVNLKQVASLLNPDKTISLEFSQMDDDVAMLLSIKNPFAQMMKFNIDMIDFEGKPHQTSSCPVMAGKALFEHWPHAIPEIIISNIRVLENTDTMVCEY